MSSHSSNLGETCATQVYHALNLISTPHSKLHVERVPDATTCQCFAESLEKHLLFHTMDNNKH
jgi:hypothetical protein